MNKEIYQTMITGLLMTILEKEVVLGEVEAKDDVLKIVDMIEDLDLFWDSDSQYDPDAEELDAYLEKIRVKYRQGGGNEAGISKPSCKLSGEDGNIFSLIARASKALKEAGQAGEADEMTARVFQTESYNNALQVIMEYVEVE